MSERFIGEEAGWQSEESFEAGRPAEGESTEDAGHSRPAGNAENYSPRPGTLRSRVLAAVEAAGKPVRAPGLAQMFIAEGDERMSSHKMQCTLANLYHLGKIKRLGEGVYAALDAADDSFETVPTSRDRITEALSASGRAMTIDDLAEHFREQGLAMSGHGLLDSLRHLTDKKKIRRLGKGFYACLDFDSSSHHDSKTSGRIIVEILDQNGQALCIDTIANILKLDYGRSPTRGSVMDDLTKLAKQKKIKQLGKGFYARAGFDGSDHFDSKSGRDLILMIINRHEEALDVGTVAEILKLDYGRHMTKSGVRGGLSRLAKQGKIKCTDRGYYAATGLQRSANPYARSRSLLKEYGHLAEEEENIVESLRGEGYRVDSNLRDFIRRRLV